MYHTDNRADSLENMTRNVYASVTSTIRTARKKMVNAFSRLCFRNSLERSSTHMLQKIVSSFELKRREEKVLVDKTYSRHS
jgi:tRNA C32,U32 (ribose-2'-O)-methylase TrmJ